MASDYAAIKEENIKRYGTDIGRYGPMLLADRYDDRTHFIFELLQNTEDALARRSDWKGSRSVSFHLTKSALRVSHFGHPFNEADVRGICGIAESTKDLTAIGRFGIGFKSVYAFTDHPEIHSGKEDFAIKSFVWPVAAPSLDRDPDETVILIPLKPSDQTGHEEIASGLRRLGPTALLFLRQIEEIQWNVESGRSGSYLRESKDLDTGIRRVTVIGQEQGEAEIDEIWLIFSRPVTTKEGRHAGHVEIAFFIARDEKSRRESIQRIDRSALVVFFPTILETYLGFLVQGPFRTTPSRDNVPRNDPWNQYLVSETASLLVETLFWLRDHDLLDTTTLRSLPLDPMKFSEASMFAPLYAATKKALSSDPLLPRYDRGYVSAQRARLARTQELRELFTPAQLAAIYGEMNDLPWLSGDITQDRTPELRKYLIQELNIAEITPETIIPKFDKTFLEAQPDAWILDLYHFLSSQPALRWRLNGMPLIRLEDGTHVVAHLNNQPQAFLPGPIETGFPAVRRTVCATDVAWKFLQSLGLTEPDLVDDVVRNLLPKYRADKPKISNDEYAADIHRLLKALATDSKGQREKLLVALRDTAFVMSVDLGDGSKWRSKPNNVYLGTERLKDLFSGVGKVYFVDDTYDCLRGEEIRDLLLACGAARYLKPIPVEPNFTWEERRMMRMGAGCESSSGSEYFEDVTLRGLDGLLNRLSGLDAETKKRKAALLWEALGDVEGNLGTGTFLGTYHWTYYHSRYTSYDATFVQQLNDSAWVPDMIGALQKPKFVMFEGLGWKVNPFLQSKIRFKPPVIEMLAREAGLDPGMLDLLKKLGVTSEAELRARLGLKAESAPGGKSSQDDVDDALKKLLGDMPPPTPLVPDQISPSPPGSGDTGRGRNGGGGETTGVGVGTKSDELGATSDGSKRTTDTLSGRKFISYVAILPDEEERDPDGLDQTDRMALEEKAIVFILQSETQLQRTSTHNPGFDLFELRTDGQIVRWIEVKAMTSSLTDRPVGMSHTQFKCAQEYGEAYWLYVVEHAGGASPRIVRIQDPAGKARTFTFDCGWLSVADEETEQENQED